MKLIRSILFCVCCCCMAFGSGEELIRKQFVEYFAQQDETSDAGEYLSTIHEDGTWADIDYASQRRGNWPTRKHLTRLEDMAAAYNDTESGLFRDETLKQVVLNGLNHWLEKDYRNPNWFNARIGIPKHLGGTLLLMGDAVPKEMLEAARPILYRSELGMTGQNKVWCAGIGIVKGLLYDDRKLLERAVEDIWSELRVSTEEGIQPDWSFHQHGPQQQFGNYGLSFGRDMIQWALILRGTDYALSGEKLSILRNYMLQGVSWVEWKGRLDFSACGRQIDQGYQLVKGSDLLRQLERMKQVDPPFAAQYGSTQERIGFKPFWRSEMAVQRRPDWYASVKMSSSRVIGAESVNSENVLGLHMGDGVLLTTVDGTEYEDLAPLWDWKRLPGTTCDQGLDKLTPDGSRGSYGGSYFAGVLGSGDTGIAAMIYQRGDLTARKSWFFFKEHIVCLGAGISGKTKGPVYTSVEQSRLTGEVVEGESLLKTGTEYVPQQGRARSPSAPRTARRAVPTQNTPWLKPGRFILHDRTVYEFLDGEPMVKAGTVTGNWNRVYPVRGDRPAEGEVFNLWIDHGKSPDGATYAYRIAPTGKVGTDPFQSEILQNSETLQAVKCGDSVYAVFYEAGVLKFGEGQRIEVSAPCLLIADSQKVTVCDPTHTFQTLDITVNGQEHPIDLPQGEELGKQVELSLAK